MIMIHTILFKWLKDQTCTKNNKKTNKKQNITKKKNKTKQASKQTNKQTKLLPFTFLLSTILEVKW